MSILINTPVEFFVSMLSIPVKGAYSDLFYTLIEQVTPAEGTTGPTSGESELPQSNVAPEGSPTPPERPGKGILIFFLVGAIIICSIVYFRNGTPSPEGLFVDTSIPMRSSIFTSTAPTGITSTSADTPLPPNPSTSSTFSVDHSSIAQAQATRLPTPTADSSASSATFDCGSSDSDLSVFL